MTMSPPDSLSDAARLGLTYYDEHLKTVLEPSQNGRAIALHVDTKEYVVADTLAQARREMHERYPNPEGRILSRTIGPGMNEPLVRRILSGHKR